MTSTSLTAWCTLRTHDAIDHIASLQNKLPACCPYSARAKKASPAAVPHKGPAVVGAQEQRESRGSECRIVSRVRETSILCRVRETSILSTNGVLMTEGLSGFPGCI